MDESIGKSTKLPFVTFQPNTIMAKQAATAARKSFGDPSGTYTINCKDGSAIWEALIIQGKIKLQCAKSERKQTPLQFDQLNLNHVERSIL